MKKLLKKSYILIGFIIFLWVIKDIDFAYFKGQLSNLDFIYLPFAALLYIPILILQAYRFKKMVGFQNIKYSLKESFYIIGISTMLAIATPGRIGDFSKIIYLKKGGHPLGKSILSSVLEKAFDFSFILILCATFFAFLPIIPQIQIDYKTIAKWTLPIMLLSVSSVFYFYKTSEKIKAVVNDIFLGLKQYKPRRILFIFLITTVTWLLYFLIVYFLAASTGVSQSLTFLFISFLGAFSVLAALLPVSVMGIGTREAIFVFLLSPFNIAKETAILFSLLIMANYLTLVLIGIFCWFKKPLTLLN